MHWRRRLKIAVVLLFLLGLGLYAAVRYLARPERVAALLTEQARDRLGLALSFQGEPRYRLWPQLRLQLQQAQLALPGDASPLLALQQLDVSLPWSSLRDSRLVWMEGVGHMPNLEARAAFDAAFGQFLQSVYQNGESL